MFVETQPSLAVTGGASGLIRTLTLWLLLVPLALFAFFLAEITGIDLVDAVNALVYAFAAWVALALFRLGLPGYLDRLIWLGLAFFCGAFVVSEFWAESLEQGTRLPEWLGDVLCWSLTGGFIALICWRRPQAKTAVAPVLALAGAGFALHSLDLLVDFDEMRFNAWLGIDQLRFDNLTDLVEFAYLQLYLLAFIVLAAALSGQHALRRQIAAAESGEDSTAVIRNAHLAFATASLTSRLFSRRRRRQAMLALGGSAGIGAWLSALRYTRHLGPSLSRQWGISLWRQFCAQIGFIHRHHLAPKYYYMFELWRPEQAWLAGHYLQRGETKGAAYKLLYTVPVGTDTEAQRLSDKLIFHNTCRDLGLSVAPIYFASGDDIAEAQLPAADLFVKPRKGRGGNGASRWRFEVSPTPHYRGKGDVRFSAEELLIEISCSDIDFIVQPRLVNHPALNDLNCGALATVRLVTCRGDRGGHEVTDAAFRMPRSSNSVVDNFHAGGIAAAIDIATGRLGAATDMGLNPATTWFGVHPTNGAEIAGRILPHWQQVTELALAAHRHFEAFAVIGWDIAILADGPCIVEANGAPDLDIIQRTARRPLGNARLGRLMAWHLRQRIRPVLLGKE